MDRRALLGLKTATLKTGGDTAAAESSYLRLPTITAMSPAPADVAA
jgi:hypothetical protein